ncbi:MAG: DUF87 domain-containing protein [Planctomycetota bacterium]
MNKTIGRIAEKSSPLAKLLTVSAGTEGAPNRQVGFTLRMDYSHATVMVHDHWRTAVGGIPMNSYLIATNFDPSDIAAADPIDQRVVLLRMLERTEIGTDREHLEAITQYFQANPDTSHPDLSDFEVITRNRMSWSGARCHILGTFFADEEGKLRLGTDVEDMFATRQMRVHKPSPEALEAIVNYVDPDRDAKMKADAQAAGFGIPEAFPIGTVRFTSTRHMVGLSGETGVPVRVSPADFLARRTGVFGMTRTGKSNTTKTMVSEVALTAFVTRRPIGQLIFDINGEYSNVNAQDEGSAINDVFPEMTVRYRAMANEGFRDLRSNFYADLDIAKELIAHAVEEQGRLATSNDFKDFLNVDLVEPPEEDRSAHNHWRRRVSIFRSILLEAGYVPDEATAEGQEVEIGSVALADILRQGLANGIISSDDLDGETEGADDKELARLARARFDLELIGTGPKHRGTLRAVNLFWKVVRSVERDASNGRYTDDTVGIVSKKGKSGGTWLDGAERSLLSVLVGRSSLNDGPISGPRAIGAAKDYHGAGGSEDVSRDIYRHLVAGRIVILDLSVGSPSIRDRLSQKIVREVFRVSGNYFNRGDTPPSLVIYVEEAHNLIGKRADLTEIWPRIAKEGAKFGIALVYATQEPSSVHPNILANTENFFVTHLNNDAEIRALASFYDFADFGPGLKRSQDVGFARIKTLSANFVTPTQITRFDPATVKLRYAEARALDGNDWFKPVEPIGTGA